jgi:hypothetical protein
MDTPLAPAGLQYVPSLGASVPAVTVMAMPVAVVNRPSAGAASPAVTFVHCGVVGRQNHSTDPSVQVPLQQCSLSRGSAAHWIWLPASTTISGSPPCCLYGLSATSLACFAASPPQSS